MVRFVATLLFVPLTTGAVAAGQHEDSLSLLQKAAVKKHNSTLESKWANAHLMLPCVGSSIDSTMKDIDLQVCRSWGDVHTPNTFLDTSLRHSVSTSYQYTTIGVSRAAKARDGSWEIQMYQFPCGTWGCQVGAAVRVGSMKFEVYRTEGKNYECRMGNGVPCSASGQHGKVTWSYSYPTFCLEVKNQFALTVHKLDWGAQLDMIIHSPKKVKTATDTMCNEPRALQDGKSCNDPGVTCTPTPGYQGYTTIPPHENPVTPEEMIFSKEALSKLCPPEFEPMYATMVNARGDDSTAKVGCDYPDEPVISVEDTCAKNGIAFADVEAACASLRRKFPAFYDDCLVDECVKINPEEVADITMIAEETDESNTCLIEPCDADDICSATPLSLDMSQSNLGGKGPDSGAEEIRFSNAATMKGVLCDLVIVSTSPYKPNKPENNVASNGIGVINLDGGSDVSLTFSMVKSGTNDECEIDGAFMMSFLDVDKGKRGNIEAVSVCGADNIYLREVSTLLTEKLTDDCHQVTADGVGSGADNPTSPTEMTEAQKLKSFDISVSKSSFTIQLEVKEKAGRQSARNFMFAGGSVVGHCEE